MQMNELLRELQNFNQSCQVDNQPGKPTVELHWNLITAFDNVYYTDFLGKWL